MEAVVAKVKNMIRVTCIIQVVNTLNYLSMDGHIRKATNLFVSMLNVKPLVSMEDGEIVIQE